MSILDILEYETIDGKQYNKKMKEERTLEIVIYNDQTSLHRIKQKIICIHVKK